jgi:hypothetical protein
VARSSAHQHDFRTAQAATRAIDRGARTIESTIVRLLSVPRPSPKQIHIELYRLANAGAEAIFKMLTRIALDAAEMAARSAHAPMPKPDQITRVLAPFNPIEVRGKVPDVVTIKSLMSVHKKNPATLAQLLVKPVENGLNAYARWSGIAVGTRAKLLTFESAKTKPVAYQVFAVIDKNTRPEHYKRSGTIYYRNPKVGQLGFKDMPRPPYESPRMRNAWAPNCRCSLGPIYAARRV